MTEERAVGCALLLLAAVFLIFCAWLFYWA